MNKIKRAQALQKFRKNSEVEGLKQFLTQNSGPHIFCEHDVLGKCTKYYRVSTYYRITPKEMEIDISVVYRSGKKLDVVHYRNMNIDNLCRTDFEDTITCFVKNELMKLAVYKGYIQDMESNTKILKKLRKEKIEERKESRFSLSPVDFGPFPKGHKKRHGARVRKEWPGFYTSNAKHLVSYRKGHAISSGRDTFDIGLRKNPYGGYMCNHNRNFKNNYLLGNKRTNYYLEEEEDNGITTKYTCKKFKVKKTRKDYRPLDKWALSFEMNCLDDEEEIIEAAEEAEILEEPSVLMDIEEDIVEEVDEYDEFKEFEELEEYAWHTGFVR